ncbi:MAG TPA: hypothetical protein VKX96_04235 [Chloroflexota bacterium]|nr:hypothetical protein [Chloroflexota bacterium]
MKLRFSVFLAISCSIAVVVLAACSTSSSPSPTPSAAVPAPTSSSPYPALPTQPARPSPSGGYPALSSPTTIGGSPAPAIPTASSAYPAPTGIGPTPASITPLPSTTPAAAHSPLASSHVSIEVISQSPKHETISPGQTAIVPVGSGEIGVLVHYPDPIGSLSGGAFQPYRVTITVDPPDWQAQIGNPPNNTTLSFQLRGKATGHFTVNVSSMPTNPSVTFGLNVVNPLTPTAVPVASGAVGPSGVQ